MVDGATKRYELTSVWSILNDVISTNITDPAIPKREKSGDWIRNGFPNPGDVNKKNGFIFPIVVIMIPDIEDEVKVLDQSKHLVTHSISIECHSRTRLEAAELSEEIRYILQVTAKDELRTGCVHLIGINGTSEDSTFIGGGDKNKDDEHQSKYYTKTIDYHFQRFD